jgi:hypothetical protein
MIHARSAPRPQSQRQISCLNSPQWDFSAIPTPPTVLLEHSKRQPEYCLLSIEDAYLEFIGGVSSMAMANYSTFDTNLLAFRLWWVGDEHGLMVAISHSRSADPRPSGSTLLGWHDCVLPSGAPP